jgi:hypothetical protein
MNSFITLNREFTSISKDYKFDEESYDLSFKLGTYENKKWDDILKLQRVIILAEAGAGKTEELKFITKSLRTDAKKAFFLRLEHIASNFNTSFDIGEYNEFEEWIASDEIGWFFLDSVDEARLIGIKHFENAIRTFASELCDNKQRAHIYITSRVSEWRAQTDLEFIKNKLPFFKLNQVNKESNIEFSNFSDKLSNSQAPLLNKEEKILEPSIFALSPLNEEQRRVFSKEFRVKNIDAFLKAIQKAEADIFCRRPQDLIDLIIYWNKYKKISNFKKLIESSISSKLQENDNDRSDALPLTPDDARRGAEMIAAAVTFQRKNRILIKEQHIDNTIKNDTIDSQIVLKNWEYKKIRALLQRPIFDNAIYGTVRFHHRSVREYLTAKWLHRLLLNGKSRRSIENLFFAKRYGQKVVIPSMRPILAWLILFDDNIREKAANIAPEVFIEGGDPSALPTDIRKNMLKKLCTFYANQKVTDLSFDISQVRRLAHKDLGETINELLEIYSEHKKLRELLLQIIWQGEIRACSKKALSFVLNNIKNDIYTCIYGIRAIETAGSKEQKNKIIKVVLVDSTINNEKLIGELITAFAPNELDIQKIITLLERIELEDKHSYSWLIHVLKEFSLNKCPTGKIFEWLTGLLLLLKRQPFIENRDFEISQRYCWFLPYAILAVERLVKIKHSNALEDNVLKIISFAQKERSFDIYYHHEEHSLSELVPKWQELNHALFWFNVNSKRNNLKHKKDERLIKWWQAGFDRYWEFNNDDFEKILEDINLKKEIDDRLVALSLVMNIK